MPIKIVDMTNEPAPSGDDLLVVRDNASGTTRKVTITQLFTNPPISNGSLTTAMYADGSVTKAKLAADAKISVRTNTQTSPSTLTPAVDDYDMFIVTNLNGGMTIAAPTGTPVSGQGLLIRIKDDGTSRSLTWNAVWRAIGVTLPSTTVAGKLLYVSARYNIESLKWDVLSIGREA